MTFLFLFVNQNRETFKPSFILCRVSAIQRGDTRICVVQRGLQCNSVWNQPSPWGDGLHGLWSDTTPISSLTTVCQKVCLIYYAPSQFYSCTARRSLTVGLCYLGGQTDNSNTGSFHCWVALAKLRLNSAQCITYRQKGGGPSLFTACSRSSSWFGKKKNGPSVVCSLYLFFHILCKNFTIAQ